MSKLPAQSNLFLIRLWEDPHNREGEWRGKIQHMNSSLTSRFQDWETLREALIKMLAASRSEALHDEDEAQMGGEGSVFEGAFPHC